MLMILMLGVIAARKISIRLLTRLYNLPRRDNRIWIFIITYHVEKNLRKERLAYKIGNPRLLQIHFHTLHYWKGTFEYVKTKDSLHVQKLLDHRSLKNTPCYTQFVALPQNEEYICKTAKTTKEAKELIEAGFTYVTEMDNTKILRKPKASYLGP